MNTIEEFKNLIEEIRARGAESKLVIRGAQSKEDVISTIADFIEANDPELLEIDITNVDYRDEAIAASKHFAKSDKSDGASYWGLLSSQSQTLIDGGVKIYLLKAMNVKQGAGMEKLQNV